MARPMPRLAPVTMATFPASVDMVPLPVHAAVRVAAGSQPPPDAYVAVRDRDHWFYIDDRDRQFKATLALMLQLGRLDAHRPRPAAPPPTLTAGR